MPATLYPEKRPEKEILAAKFEIEHEDVLHLKNLYKRIYDWLVDEGWKSADGDDEQFETLYWERVKPNEAQEHHIWWRAYRKPEGSPYIRYFMRIDFQTLNMKKIEIMHKGQKFGTNKGDVILRVEAWMQLDYDKGWEKSSLLQFFDRWFRTRLYFEEIDKLKTNLYAEAYRLNTMIKQYLQFKPTVMDWGRPFHPEKGV